MPTFDLWQTAYTLAQMSGSVSTQQGEPATLAAALNTALDTFYADSNTIAAIGQWSTVWGPCIFESSPGSSSYADNSIYVAYSSDLATYVVGTAGTNPKSKYDIDQEDLAVNTTVAWDDAFPTLAPYGVPSSLGSITPYISTGTALGVNNVLGLVDGIQGTKEDLVSFLSGLTSTSSATLIFCGHSLAGALSPTIALALFNPDQGKLAASNWAHVYVYPTAGPTPGNADYGTFFSTVFPEVGPPGSTPYQVWNSNVCNTLDAVPHAWQLNMLSEIPTLYPVSWKSEPFELKLAMNYLTNQSTDGGDTAAGPYEMFTNTQLSGTFNTGIPVSDMSSFKQQALYQHTTAYDVLLNVTSLAPAAKTQAAYAPLVHALLTPPDTK